MKKIYVFGELLGHPNVQALESTDKPLLDLLRIFAYGTYSDYKAQPSLPELSDVEITKLKRLSLVSRAADNSCLDFKSLMAELHCSSQRELEDLILETVVLGLVEGQLDQSRQVFEVQFAMGRDIGPQDVDTMLDKLTNWLDHSMVIKQELRERTDHANGQLKASEMTEHYITAERKNVIAAVALEKEDKGGRLGAMMSGVMGPGSSRRGAGSRSSHVRAAHR